MTTGIPIRLVRNDGYRIPLLAQDIALDVSRKIGGMALPFTGSTRVGFDFNMNDAVIVINGIINDDTVAPGDKVGASGVIDFGCTHYSASLETKYDWATSAHTGNLINIQSGIKLVATDDSEYTITFHRGGSPSYTTSATHMDIQNNASLPISATAAATNLAAAIAAIAGTPFTTSIVTSPFSNASTRVVITQSTTGKNGNTRTPFPSKTFMGSFPYFSLFKGGKAGESKSAGDKVMDLWGTLNNSNNGGMSVMSGYLGAISGLGIAAEWLGIEGAGDALDVHDLKYGDYIIGIQIPYNSMIKSTTLQTYEPVNFFMPTGAMHTKDSKGSEKARKASTKFTSWTSDGDYTGIKGSIQKATFTQLAGEPIYSFTIVFAPMDWII